MRTLSLAVVFVGIAICCPVIAANFDSPEAALQGLESAYVSKDIDAVIAAKDFDAEARFVLYEASPALAADADVVNQASKVLEKSFRVQIQSRGFPRYEEFKCSISAREEILPTVVKLTENCRLPGGYMLKQTIATLQTQKGWRVVNLDSLGPA